MTRIHLLPARGAPFAIVIRRGPSKRFHIMRWNTETDEIEHGSWFSGRIYELRSDVSPDGQWMVYLARGGRGWETWNGLCRPPFLKTVIDWEDIAVYYGGGVFVSPYRLEASAFHTGASLRRAVTNVSVPLPFEVVQIPNPPFGGDLEILHRRFKRDGWKEIETSESGLPVRWTIQPTPGHPTLVASRFLLEDRRVRFQLLEYPDLLDETVSWAAFDFLGQLIVGRAGAIERYTLDGIRENAPSFRLDLNDLATPWDEDSEVRKPQIFVYFGAATDADAVVLGLVQGSSEASAVLSLAGEEAKNEYARRSQTSGDSLIRMPAYYLRHQSLFLVPDGPGASVMERLLETAAEQSIRSLALGASITEGREEVCVALAQNWVTEHAERRVRFVARHDAHAAALAAAIDGTD